MSCWREERVWRAPFESCGISEDSEQDCWDWDEEEEWIWASPLKLGWNEFQEEHEGLFTWDEGGFRPSLCPGDYLDFVLYTNPPTWYPNGRYAGTPSSVFRKVVPDIDLDDVHYCEYEWYDGTSAPEVY